MGNKYHWYKPVQVRRMRIALTIVIVAIWGAILYLQHSWLLSLFN